MGGCTCKVLLACTSPSHDPPWENMQLLCPKLRTVGQHNNTLVSGILGAFFGVFTCTTAILFSLRVRVSECWSRLFWEGKEGQNKLDLNFELWSTIKFSHMAKKSLSVQCKLHAAQS